MTYTAPDSEALAQGYVLPTGTSLIRYGDDAIKNNAKTAAGGIRSLNNRMTVTEDYLYVKALAARNLIWPAAWTINFAPYYPTVTGSAVTMTAGAAQAGAAAGSLYLYTRNDLPFNGAETVYFNAEASAGTGAFSSLLVRIYFRDSTGALVGGAVQSGTFTTPGPISHSATVPAGATRWQVWVIGAGPTATEGDTVTIDHALAATVDHAWFDPTGPGGQWDGPPGESTSSLYAPGNGVVEEVQDLTARVSAIETGAPRGTGNQLVASLSGAVLTVAQRYSSTHDLRVKLAPLPPNDLHQIASAHLVPADEHGVTTDTTTGTVLLSSVTDSFGPWQITADTNADGDQPASLHFTGGVHGYNNDTTGTATARRTALRFAVDGRPATDLPPAPASRVEAWWTTYVQATNTKKADGTGREVLQEDYHLTITAEGWHVECLATALEPLTVKFYYGLQSSTTPWSDRVLFHDADPAAWLDMTANRSAGPSNKVIPQISLNGGTHRLDMTVDTTRGLGRRLSIASDGAFTSGSKAYMRLAQSSPLAAGQIIEWQGAYRFWSES